MDNKIILELIKKDLDEIRMLVEALEKSNDNEQLLIDITSSKARTLLDEISLLKSNTKAESTVSETEFVTNTQKHEEIERVETVLADKVDITESEEIKAEEIQETETEEVKEAIELKTEIEEVKKDDIAEDIVIESSVEQEPNTEENITEKPIVAEKEELPINENANQVEEEEESSEKESKILGENFTKEPSLNERFATNNVKTKNINQSN